MAGSQFALRQQVDRSRMPVRRRHPARSATHLQVGAADDPAERRADLVAGQVLSRLRAADRPPDPPSRGVAAGAAPEVGDAGGELSAEVSGRIGQARGGGRPMDPGLRERMQDAFGPAVDLGRVRLHTGEEAGRLNRAVSARAFTIGQDIFFGSGEYRPDTDGGLAVLAHELAHTASADGTGRRAVHRWWRFHPETLDVARNTASIRTLADRPVWFLADQEGDELVVKPENLPIGLSTLAGFMHNRLRTGTAVEQLKMIPADVDGLGRIILDKGLAKDASWADFGAKVKAGRQRPGNMAWFDPPDDIPDDSYGRLYAQQLIADPITVGLMAMTKAPGATANDRAKQNAGTDAAFMREQLSNLRHVGKLGEVTALDLFLGNEDRVLAANLGNWLYDANGSMTLIDHVDSTRMANNLADPDNTAWTRDGGCGHMLRSTMMRATVDETIDLLVRRINGLDPGFTEWVNAEIDGVPRVDRIKEAFYQGMKAGRKRIVGVFSATRFTLGGGRRRTDKKAVKQQALQSKRTDSRIGDTYFGGGDAPDYYHVLKDRAAWLARR